MATRRDLLTLPLTLAPADRALDSHQAAAAAESAERASVRATAAAVIRVGSRRCTDEASVTRSHRLCVVFEPRPSRSESGPGGSEPAADHEIPQRLRSCLADTVL